MRHNDREVCGDGKDVSHGPGLKKVEGDVDMRLEEGLECHEPLLDLLGGVPVGVAGLGTGVGRAGIGPALEKLLHCINRLAGFVIGDVDDVVEEELGGKTEGLTEEVW